MGPIEAFGADRRRLAGKRKVVDYTVWMRFPATGGVADFRARAVSIRAVDRANTYDPTYRPAIMLRRPRIIFCGPFETSFIIFCVCSNCARS